MPIHTRTRQCHICGKTITYKAKYKSRVEKSFNTALQNNTPCMSCGKKLWFKNNPLTEEKLLQIKANRPDFSRENNPFYGKKHSEESKELISKNTKTSFSVRSKEEQDKINKKTANTGKRNGMFGKSIYKRWVEIYGEEEAQRRQMLTKAKQSVLTSGKNNPMFNKPTPQGSGNGWKGWFKTHYFRSLRELSFIIYLLDNTKSWKSAESIAIPYIFHGKQRTYRPDFIVENILYEIKPKKLINSPSVLAKTEAAKKYCETNNLIFIIQDYPIDTNRLKKEFMNNNIKFSEKYHEKFKKYILE